MKYYIVDSFTEKRFAGNPAAVCLLENELDERKMQNIAAEINLAETAFVKRSGDNFDLRWFSPEVEVDLCGHATFASAFVITNYIDKGRREMIFNTKSGELRVRVKTNLVDLSNLYEVDLPAWEVQPAEITELMTQAVVGAKILEAHSSRDLLLLFNSEEEIVSLKPDFDSLRNIPDCRAVVVTAKGNKADFVSRCFAPNMGVPEDHATGSTHTELIPFWAKKLDKNIMTSLQLSKRGGAVYCEYYGDRVTIAGRAALNTESEVNYNIIIGSI